MLLVGLASACAHAPQPDRPAPIAVSLPRQAMGPDQPTSFELPAGAHLLERNRCIDRELAELHLNEFGDAEGTTYPEGSPLLGAAKGAERHDYVLRRRPEIGVRCARVLGEPTR